MFSGEVWFDSKQGQRAEFKQGQSWFSSLWLVHPSLCRRSTSWQEVPQRRETMMWPLPDVCQRQSMGT